MKNMAQTLGVLALAASAAWGQTISSTFDTDTESWEVRGISHYVHLSSLSCALLPAHDPAEGLPAGSLRVGDVCAEVALSAPPAYLGDRSAYLGGQLSFDILVRYTDGVAYPAVLLRSPTKTLFYVMPTTAADVWGTRIVPLTPGGWTVNGAAGPPATTSDLLDVLGELENLLIVTEWNTGPDDTNVDNVVLQPPSGGAAAYGRGCAHSAGSVPGLWVGGTVSSGGSVSIQVDGGPAGGLAFLGIGLGQTSLPLGSGCDLLVLPLAQLMVLPPLDKYGRVELTAPIPAGFPPGPWLPLQAGALDLATSLGFALSNGVQLTLM